MQELLKLTKEKRTNGIEMIKHQHASWCETLFKVRWITATLHSLKANWETLENQMPALLKEPPRACQPDHPGSQILQAD